MARLRIYTVHERPGSRGAMAQAPVLIREGFSWAAALFTFLWAIFHGLWRQALALLVIGMGIGLAIEIFDISAAFEMAITLGYLAFVGFGAQDWRRAQLVRQGYVLRDVVVEKTSELALLRYLQSLESALESAVESGMESGVPGTQLTENPLP